MGFFDPKPTPPPEKSNAEIIQDMVMGGLEILEMMKPLLDTVDGYRAECERRGYSEEESRVMAVMFHNNMMTQIGKPDSA